MTLAKPLESWRERSIKCRIESGLRDLSSTHLPHRSVDHGEAKARKRAKSVMQVITHVNSESTTEPGGEGRVTMATRIHLDIRSTLVKTSSEGPIFPGIGRTAPSVWTAQAEIEVEYVCETSL